jgi:AAHS family 4-hydroxybenzoate transporter-like MFS transporter
MHDTAEPIAHDVAKIIDEAPISAFQIRVIALCSVATFLDGYDVQALGVTVPHIARAFGVEASAFGFAFSGSLVGMALGATMLSPLADRLGRRAVLIAMMVLVGLTTLGATFSMGITSMTIWRVLSGFGLGAIVPIAMTMTSEYAPARHRAALITLMVVCTALGAFTAGFAAPYIEQLWGWRGVFGVGAVLPLIAAVILWIALPQSLLSLVIKDPENPDIKRQLSKIVPNLSAVKFTVKTAGIQIDKASVKTLFSKKLYLRTTLVWIVMGVNMFANYALISWLPTLLDSAGWPLAQAQQSVGLLALGGVGGGLILAWLADRGWAIVSFSLAYAAVALALCLFMSGLYTGPLWLLFSIIGLGAFGSGMAFASFAASFYPPAIRSTGVGWFSGISRATSIFGPLTMAAMMKAGVDPVTIIGLLMIPMVICILCVIQIPRALKSG